MNQTGESSRKDMFVAVLMPDTRRVLANKDYYGAMVQGLSDELMRKGLHIRPIQCLHGYQKEHFLHSPHSLYCGVVFMALYQDKLFIRAVVESLPGPKVVLDHHFDDLSTHSVREDAVGGMRALTEHLLSLGHRHIAYVDMSRPDANPWKREGVNLALREAGLPELARGWVAGCRDNFSDAAAALEWFLEMKPRPTAVICCDDVRALFLLQAAAERGLRIPNDLSISGYGDAAVRTGRSKVLTSASVDVVEMGRRAAELAAGDPDAKPVSVLVPLKLEVRGTTAGPPA